ncbi:MAG: Asp-tRNA(Asn)/Glu-tRNA(Gln) amidotransferase subunit GatB [bacterium]|nr:Asp-tRNA(Asn)/Glu-tRNA(Gln) amidotransferase subunit GatB [bacterium]
MSNYLPTIGLEIHAELKTRTKMFCDSKNDPDESRSNWNVCPVCMGHPGTLPVINKEAVKHVLKVGVALGGTLADFTEFDRKNYFYPDIPKGYQLSQYQYPLVKGGTLNDVAITRVHLEEDTATSLHEEGDYSLVDFNRAGVPLMELVTEPVIDNAKQAGDFARELQLLLRYLHVSEANMEKGEMRVEANISVSKEKGKFGTKVEVKNLNSFRAVERAIAFEVERQKALLESGEKIIQETRGWDENTQKTFTQRRKEESHDYRYFPDPDLPKLLISKLPEFATEKLKSEMGELPQDKRKRYVEKFGIKSEDVEVLVTNRALGALFEDAAQTLSKELMAVAANYAVSDLMGLLKKKNVDADSAKFAFGGSEFGALIAMIGENKISSRGAKDTLSLMFEQGGNPESIAKEKGLLQKSDAGELKAVVTRIIEANPKVAADFKAGKGAALQFLVGQGMKETKGAGNPAVLRKLFEEALS